MLLTPEDLITLIEKLRAEWAKEGVRNPNRDLESAFAYGIVCGRDQGMQAFREEVERLMAEETEEERSGSISTQV